MARVSLSTFAIICMLYTVFRSPAQANAGKEDDDSKFGESVEEYPEGTIKNLLSEASPLIQQYLKRAKVPGFGNRHNSFDSAEHSGMCKSIESVDHPKQLKNTKGVLRNIVNVEKNYQPVYTEICKKDVTCRLKEYFPLEYESECKQKYSVKRLLVASDPGLVWDNFDIPCGCVCSLKRTTSE